MGISDNVVGWIEVVNKSRMHYLQLAFTGKQPLGTEPLTCEFYAQSGKIVSVLS